MPLETVHQGVYAGGSQERPLRRALLTGLVHLGQRSQTLTEFSSCFYLDFLFFRKKLTAFATLGLPDGAVLDGTYSLSNGAAAAISGPGLNPCGVRRLPLAQSSPLNPQIQKLKSRVKMAKR